MNMLLPKKTNPLDSIYYNGAIIIKELQDTTQELDIVMLYKNINSVKEMSMPIFILSLDWLYIAGIAEVDEKGSVQICSSND